VSASAVRLMVGLPVGALFPLGVPGLRDDLRAHAGASLAFCLLIVAPDLDQWRGWVLLALAAAVSVGIRVRLGPSRGPASAATVAESVTCRTENMDRIHGVSDRDLRQLVSAGIAGGRPDTGR